MDAAEIDLLDQENALLELGEGRHEACVWPVRAIL
jgi:hypothetical protein